MKRCLFLLCLPVLLLAGCADLLFKPAEPPAVAVAATAAPETEVPETAAPTEAPTQPEPTEPPDYVTSLMQEMTLRQKVGQLFIVHPDSLDPPPDPAEKCAVSCTPAMMEAMEKYPVGGIIMFGENIESPEQIKRFNADLQACSDIPLFLCVDEEAVWLQDSPTTRPLICPNTAAPLLWAKAEILTRHWKWAGISALI